MRRSRTLLASLALGLTLLLCLAAAPRVHALDRDIILGGPQEGWPPFSIPGSGGEPARGIMPDVLRTVAAGLEIGVTDVYYPEKRGMLQLTEGGLDVWAKSECWVNDPDQFLWTDPVITSTDILVFRHSDPIPFHDLADLSGRSLCVVLGYSYPTLAPFFARGTIQRRSAPTVRHMLRMLDRGYVDGAVCNRFVAEWILREDEELRPEDFGYSETTIDSAPYRFAFTRARDWSGFIERFNLELAAMRQDGRLEAILNRYR